MKIIIDTRPTKNGKAIGIITLNNPKALNAQDLEMVQIMTQTLKAWESDDTIAMVVLCGAGDKALCAGGDIKSLAQADKAGALAFFEQEYGLMAYMHRYAKPILAWGNGIVMGGGLGLLASCSHKVATESTLMAMPEVSIGLFPDAGASYFLNKMMGKVGLFLGLTGARFTGMDARFLGLADFLISHQDFEILLNELTTLKFDHQNNHQILTVFLNKFCNPSLYQPSAMIASFDEINQLMNQGDLLAVDNALLNYQGDNPIIKNAIDIYKQGSSITKALTWSIYHKIKQDKNISLDDIFAMETKVATHCVAIGDFKEGVRALLIDKDKNPNWQYTINTIPTNYLEQFFK